MNWDRLLERFAELWLLLAGAFGVFVCVLVWRAALQIRSLRRRLDDFHREFRDYYDGGREEAFSPSSAVEAETDWVPRK